MQYGTNYQPVLNISLQLEHARVSKRSFGLRALQVRTMQRYALPELAVQLRNHVLKMAQGRTTTSYLYRDRWQNPRARRVAESLALGSICETCLAWLAGIAKVVATIPRLPSDHSRLEFRDIRFLDRHLDTGIHIKITSWLVLRA